MIFAFSSISFVFPNEDPITYQALIYTFFGVRLLNGAPFCKNYAKLYFDAKHLEKGLDRAW